MSQHILKAMARYMLPRRGLYLDRATWRPAAAWVQVQVQVQVQEAAWRCRKPCEIPCCFPERDRTICTQAHTTPYRGGHPGTPQLFWGQRKPPGHQPPRRPGGAAVAQVAQPPEPTQAPELAAVQGLFPDLPAAAPMHPGADLGNSTVRLLNGRAVWCSTPRTVPRGPRAGDRPGLPNLGLGNGKGNGRSVVEFCTAI